MEEYELNETRKEWILFGYCLKNIRKELIVLEDDFTKVFKSDKKNRSTSTLIRVINALDKYRSEMDDELSMRDIFKDDIEFKNVIYGDSKPLFDKYCKEL